MSALASPTANMLGTDERACALLTMPPERGSITTPISSRPRLRTFGTRPIDSKQQSTILLNVVPLVVFLSSQSTPSACVGSSFNSSVLLRISTPRAWRFDVTSSDRSSSSSGNKRARLLLSRCTCVRPKFAKMVANSQPMTLYHVVNRSIDWSIECTSMHQYRSRFDTAAAAVGRMRTQLQRPTSRTGTSRDS